MSSLRSTASLVAILAFLVIVSIVPVSGAATAQPTAPSVASPMPAPSSAPPFFPNLKITDGSSPYAWQVEPTMVLNASGTIFVGWKETDGPEAAGRRVGFSYSTDGGGSWARNIIMPQSHPDGGCSNSDPWLALSPEDRAHFAYLEYACPGGLSGLNVANTTNGEDWGTVHFVNGGAGTDKDTIAFDSSGRLYATWDASNVMAVTWSDDDGATWKTPFVDPDDGIGGLLGGIIGTAPNGTVYVVWWDFGSGGDIWFDWSADRGTTWHTDKRVNDIPGSADMFGPWGFPLPAMNIDQQTGAIYVAWPDFRNGNQDVFISSSTDGGSTWSSNVRINDDTGTTQQWMVDLAIDSAGTVHAAWEDKRSGAWHIMYANSTDGGQTWSENIPVTDEETPGSYTRPGDYFAIEAGSDDAIYVVWTDGRGDDFDIFFARNPGFPAAAVTIATDPAGRNVEVDGVMYPAPANFVWILETTHTIRAPSPQPVAAGTQYDWRSWSDGGSQTHDIVATADATITATFQLQYEARLFVEPEILTILVDSVSFTGTASLWWDAGSPHVLEAPSPQFISADVRFVWVSWSDGGASTHTVTAGGPYTATATFQEERTLLLQTDPAGRAVVLDGVSYTGPATIWLPPGSVHSVSVEPLQQGGPGTRYRFASWSDGGAETHTFTFSTTMALTARFDTEYLLTVTSEVPGASGGGWYPAGSTAQASVANTIIDTAPGARMVFTGWGGDASGTAATSAPITMNGPKTAVANYEEEFFLTVQTSYGATSGSGWYRSGTSAVAGVTPSTQETGPGVRQAFAGWTGDAAGTGTASNPILMDAPKTAVATWRTEYLVSVASDYPGVEGGGWYAAGAIATLSAPAQVTSGGQTFNFAGWSGDVVSTDSTVTVTVNGPIDVRALWSPVSAIGAPPLAAGIGLLVAAIVATAVVVVIVLRRRASR